MRLTLALAGVLLTFPAFAQQVVQPLPLTPSSALVFPATISNVSTPLFTGGLASQRLVVFNNTSSGPTLWCNENGGTAVAGQGIPIPPGGGGYLWAAGLATVPKCISDSATAVTLSGSGG